MTFFVKWEYIEISMSGLEFLLIRSASLEFAGGTLVLLVGFSAEVKVGMRVELPISEGRDGGVGAPGGRRDSGQ